MSAASLELQIPVFPGYVSSDLNTFLLINAMPEAW